NAANISLPIHQSSIVKELIFTAAQHPKKGTTASVKALISTSHITVKQPSHNTYTHQKPNQNLNTKTLSPKYIRKTKQK
ncbi:hypothetical protein, partial [Neokomagataea anthophila]